MQSANELRENQQYEERNGHGHDDGGNKILARRISRSRSRSRSRIRTLITSLYTPIQSVGKGFKSALVTSGQICYYNLKEDEQCEERKGPTHCDDHDNKSHCKRRLLKTLIDSLHTPMKYVGKVLKNAAVMSAQIYCYTCASYYHFLLHLLGSTSSLPPITIAEINELVVTVNGGHCKPEDDPHCSTCEEEIESNQGKDGMNPCTNRFHGHCISKLLKNENCCPLCRLILHDANGTIDHQIKTSESNDEDTEEMKP